MFEGEEIALSAFILKYPSINVHFQFALHRRSLFSENIVVVQTFIQDKLKIYIRIQNLQLM